MYLHVGKLESSIKRPISIENAEIAILLTIALIIIPSFQLDFKLRLLNLKPK